MGLKHPPKDHRPASRSPTLTAPYPCTTLPPSGLVNIRCLNSNVTWAPWICPHCMQWAQTGGVNPTTGPMGPFMTGRRPTGEWDTLLGNVAPEDPGPQMPALPQTESLWGLFMVCVGHSNQPLAHRNPQGPGWSVSSPASPPPLTEGILGGLLGSAPHLEHILLGIPFLGARELGMREFPIRG